MMFWGLVLEPAKRYTQKVAQSFHLSQAALELSDGDSEPIQLILEYEGSSYILGTLSRKTSLFQVPLDLNFNAGDQISFRTIGRGRVHLTGYHIAEDDLDERLAEASELNEERLRSVLEGTLTEKRKRKQSDADESKNSKRTRMNSKNETEASEDESFEDEDSDEDISFGELADQIVDETIEYDQEDTEDEIEFNDSDFDDDLITKTEGKKRALSAAKAKVVGMNGKSPKDRKQAEIGKRTPKATKKNGSPGTKGTKTAKTDKKSPKGEKKDQNKQDFYPQKKVVEGGVIVEEIKIGDGAVAKPGKMVQVYYVGRLQSNKKQFDSTTQGPGFKFRLGRGEVIRGWDIGVNGMKVGGKRRITIPAQLGYGAKGAPPAIPPNSVLIFEVELKNIN